MTQSAAPLADNRAAVNVLTMTLAAGIIADQERCIQRFALIVVRIRQFLSNPVVTVRSTVAIASVCEAADPKQAVSKNT